MIARLFVKLWLLVGGRHKFPGVGVLMRFFCPVVPGLRSFPLQVEGVGVARLDFRDASAYGMLKIFVLGDLGNDAHLFRTLARVLTPAAVLWDVGANTGFISGYFAHPRFKLASIQAFEPNPVALKTLQSLFVRHPSVRVHPFGLGRNDCTLEMNYRASLVGSVVLKHAGDKHIQIKVRNGDGARRELNLPPPDVIKIDVEGFEPEVLAGLDETIRQSRPVIIFEHLWLTDEAIKELIPKEYSIFFLWDDGATSRNYASRRKGHDAILVPDEKSGLLSELRRKADSNSSGEKPDSLPEMKQPPPQAHRLVNDL